MCLQINPWKEEDEDPTKVYLFDSDLNASMTRFESAEGQNEQSFT